MKLASKRKINRIFYKDQTKPKRQLRLKVAVKNNSFFKGKLSGTDHT